MRRKRFNRQDIELVCAEFEKVLRHCTPWHEGWEVQLIQKQDRPDMFDAVVVAQVEGLPVKLASFGGVYDRDDLETDANHNDARLFEMARKFLPAMLATLRAQADRIEELEKDHGKEATAAAPASPPLGPRPRIVRRARGRHA